MTEVKKRRLTEYKMQLAIVQNPHLDPKDQKLLWEELNRDDQMPKSEVFDEQGFAKLKEVMSQGKAFIIKN